MISSEEPNPMRLPIVQDRKMSFSFKCRRERRLIGMPLRVHVRASAPQPSCQVTMGVGLAALYRGRPELAGPEAAARPARDAAGAHHSRDGAFGSLHRRPRPPGPSDGHTHNPPMLD
eukprot:scaffold311014_cov32-Prasinocladus_malaysianus.AAC.1